jgi:hypothetical protein
MRYSPPDIEKAEKSTADASNSDQEELLTIATEASETENAALLPGELSFPELLRYVFSTKEPLNNPLWALLIRGSLATASTVLYPVPSWKAGQAEGGNLMACAQVIGNVTCGFLVTYSISGYYVRLLIATKDVSRYLKQNNLVNKINTKTISAYCQNLFKKLHDTKFDILIVAGLTALPLTAAAISYQGFTNAPDWLSTLILIVKGGCTFVAYTPGHVLAILVITQNIVAKTILITIPFAPFSLARHIYHKMFWSERDFQETATTERQKKLQNIVCSKLLGLVNEMKVFGFQRKGCSYEPKIIAGEIYTKTEQLLAMFELYKKPTPKSSQFWFWRCLSYFNTGARAICGFAGSLLVGSSISGYIAANYELFYKLINSVVGAFLLVGPPTIASEVLTIYFGWMAITKAYDFLSKIFTCHPETPYAFKLAPFVSSIYLPIIYFLEYFSYGTALQLVHDKIGPQNCGEKLYSSLEFSAKYGIIIYGWINSTQFLEEIAEAVISRSRFSSKEKRAFLSSMNMLKRLAALINELEPSAVEKLLLTTSPELLEKFDLKKTADDEIKPLSQKTENASHKNTSQSWGNWLCFWKRNNNEEQAVDSHLMPQYASE